MKLDRQRHKHKVEPKTRKRILSQRIWMFKRKRDCARNFKQIYHNWMQATNPAIEGVISLCKAGTIFV